MKNISDNALGKFCFDSFCKHAIMTSDFKEQSLRLRTAWAAMAKDLIELIERKHSKKYRITITVEETEELAPTAPIEAVSPKPRVSHSSKKKGA